LNRVFFNDANLYLYTFIEKNNDSHLSSARVMFQSSAPDDPKQLYGK